MTKTSASGYRAIPSVDAVLRRPDVLPLLQAHGRAVVTEAAREVLDRIRRRAAAVDGGPVVEDLVGLLGEAVRRRTTSSILRVINATGVVIHTNLGRAVLSEEARRRVGKVASAYSTLEYDLEEGRRGSRSSHLEKGLSALFPDHGALAVNNNAAAVFLALNTLAEGREVVISRGELVEIGGSFRIPDVMSKSGARLREVGTTNRTRMDDYERAIGAETGLILKVHPSNYRIVGFTQEVEPAALAELAHRRGLPLMVDQGSGCMVEMSGAGIAGEPTVRWVLHQGADLVTFSGDKVLGGPQAGIVIGRRDLVDRMKVNPLHRALRLDKMSIAALEATLDSYVRGVERSEIPALRMIFATLDQVGARARQLAESLAPRLPAGWIVDFHEGTSRVGGGAAPMEELPTWLVRIRPEPGFGRSVTAMESALRSGQPPVIARVHEGALVLDPRTVDPSEEEELLRSVAEAAAQGTD